jgi:CheY-like chemotaxis protein/anti-sigma regulatory factor (Ser/Thr protein kinase)
MSTILVVDDSAVDRHLAGSLVARTAGMRAVFAADGAEALASIGRQPPDLVLTDLLMPEMDGLELVVQVRARHPSVPVVLMTAFGSEDLALRALQRGAAGFVPKKDLARELRETITRVLNVAQACRNLQRSPELLTPTESRNVIENDAALVSPLVGSLLGNLARAGLCDETDMVRVGVALHEALRNAISHGNLEAGPSLGDDHEPDQRLIEERRTQEPYRLRKVEVTARTSPNEAVYVIRDEGPGFDPAGLPDPTDPGNLGRVRGRGLVLIRTFMDEVRHNDKGNEITLSKRRGQ